MTKKLDKEEDQQTVAQRFIKDVVKLGKDNKEINEPMWLGSLMALIAQTHLQCGLSYGQFSSFLDNAKEHYRVLWDEKSK